MPKQYADRETAGKRYTISVPQDVADELETQATEQAASVARIITEPLIHYIRQLIETRQLRENHQ